jgi:hypothetical protein
MKRYERKSFRVVLVSAYCIVAMAYCPAGYASPYQGVAKPDSFRERARSLLDSAQSLPLEFRADIELTALESGKIPPSEQTMRLLAELFSDARSAQYQSQQKVVNPSAYTVLSGILASSLATINPLDSLTIQDRALRITMETDRAEAQRELQDIHFDVPPVSCESPLIPDFSRHYADISNISKKVFKDAPGSTDAYSAWVDDQIRDIKSPLQLAGMADLLSSSWLAPKDLDQKTSSFAALMSQIKATDRELWATSENHKLAASVHKLLNRQLQMGILANSLVMGYRAFLINSSRSVPCGDVQTDWNRIAADFEVLRVNGGVAESVPPIDPHQIDLPQSAGSKAVDPSVPDRTQFDSLLAKVTYFQNLRYGDGPPQEASGWESDVVEYLNRVDALEPSKESCPDCAAWLKLNALLDCFYLTPEGDYKERALEQLVRALANSPLQYSSRIAWLDEMKVLLNMSRKPSKDQGAELAQMKRDGRTPPMSPIDALSPRIRQEMKSANNPTMRLYVVADELFDAKFYSPYLN